MRVGPLAQEEMGLLLGTHYIQDQKLVIKKKVSDGEGFKSVRTSFPSTFV